MTLKLRLKIALVCVALVPVLCLSMLSLAKYKSFREEALQQNLRSQLEFLASALDRELGEVRSSLGLATWVFGDSLSDQTLAPAKRVRPSAWLQFSKILHEMHPEILNLSLCYKQQLLYSDAEQSLICGSQELNSESTELVPLYVRVEVQELSLQAAMKADFPQQLVEDFRLSLIDNLVLAPSVWGYLSNFDSISDQTKHRFKNEIHQAKSGLLLPAHDAEPVIGFSDVPSAAVSIIAMLPAQGRSSLLGMIMIEGDILVFIVAVVLVVTSLAIAMSNGITQPLDILLASLVEPDRLSRRKLLDQLIPKKDEIGRIAFKLARVTNSLEEYSYELEKRVEERSSELSRQRRAALNLAQDAQASRLHAETLRKEAEAHHVLLDAVLSSSPTGLLGLDQEWRIRFANYHCVAMFGYEAKELLGESLELIIPEFYESGLDVSLEGAEVYDVLDKRSFKSVVQGRHRQGSFFPVDLRFNPTVPETGLHTIVSVSDITRYKTITDELEYRSEQMAQLLYTVSHDLKAPLVTITGFVGLLKESLESNALEDVYEYCGIIEKSTESMRTILNDILRLSRVHTEELTLEEIDMQEFLNQLYRILLGATAGGKYSLLIEGDLPKIRSDRRKLEQIFQNIMENAFKYGCAKEGDQIFISYHEDSNYHVFSVRDFGPGIPSRFHKKIFSIFQRLDKNTTGTGLGLSIAQSAARALGGKITVESEPSKGACFRISLTRILHTIP